MIYVRISPATAEPFSRAIMRCLRPEHLRDAQKDTDKWCGVLYHPSNGWAAVELPEAETVPIHLEADGHELAAVLDIFVQDEALIAQEAAGIVGAVQAMAGQQVNPAGLIPPSWQANVMTREQAEADGWFPEGIE